MFAEKYLRSLTTSDLRDDEQHRQTEALAAAALADLSGGSGEVFGSMLIRAKYANGCRKAFESGNHDLAVVLKVWTEAVVQKGFNRGWMTIKAEWDIGAAYAMFKKIALHSLAHWLDGNCEVCRGSKVVMARTCACCRGTGKAPIEGRRREVELVEDMVSELEGLHKSHSARAGAKLRAAA